MRDGPFPPRSGDSQYAYHNLVSRTPDTDVPSSESSTLQAEADTIMPSIEPVEQEVEASSNIAQQIRARFEKHAANVAFLEKARKRRQILRASVNEHEE